MDREGLKVRGFTELNPCLYVRLDTQRVEVEVSALTTNGVIGSFVPWDHWLQVTNGMAAGVESVELEMDGREPA